MQIRVHLGEYVSRWLATSVVKRELIKFITHNCFLSNEQVILWNSYLKNFNIDWDVRRVIRYIVNNLNYQVVSNDLLINTDTIRKLPNTDYTLDLVARLINNGNQEIIGTFVFTNTFNYIETHFSKLVVRKIR